MRTIRYFLKTTGIFLISVSFLAQSIPALAPPTLRNENVISHRLPQLESQGKLIIPGGAGYIGSQMALQALVDGYDVVVIDSLVKGRQFAVDRLADMAKSLGRKFYFEKIDLCDIDACREVCKKHTDATGFINFADFIEVGESVDHPTLYYYNNLVQHINVLEVMAEFHIERYVFSSSAAVYGKPRKMPITEKTPTRPINPYGETKLFKEKIAREYGKKRGIIWTALRYFNAAGAAASGILGESHFPESHNIPLQIQRITNGEQMVVYGTKYKTRDGSCLRDYVYIEALVKAHLKAVKGDTSKSNRPYNLGSGCGITVLEVINYIAKKRGIAPDSIDGGIRAGDPDALLADSTAFSEAFEWYPKNPGETDEEYIERILTTAINWFDSRPPEALEEKPLPKYSELDLKEKLQKTLEGNIVIGKKLKEEIMRKLLLAIDYRDMREELKQNNAIHVLRDWDTIWSLSKKETVLRLLHQTPVNQLTQASLCCRELLASY